MAGTPESTQPIVPEGERMSSSLLARARGGGRVACNSTARVGGTACARAGARWDGDRAPGRDYTPSRPLPIGAVEPEL